MAWFLLRFQFNSASAKAMVEKPQDRVGPATTLVESFGGKLHHYFFALGEFDGVGIAEFPDNKSVAAFAMKAAATGAFAKFETTVLLTASEAEAAMQQAKGSGTSYKAPNA